MPIVKTIFSKTKIKKHAVKTKVTDFSPFPPFYVFILNVPSSDLQNWLDPSKEVKKQMRSK